jgi:hypothetical protein
MSTLLEINVPEGEKDELVSILGQQGIVPVSLSSRHFDGDTVASAIIELTPPILTFLAGLYMTRIRSNKHVSYKKAGMEIKGVSEAGLLKILESIAGEIAHRHSQTKREE